jgi:hypothetical protein
MPPQSMAVASGTANHAIAMGRHARGFSIIQGVSADGLNERAETGRDDLKLAKNI